ncbi:unnamed protein product [Moneuplotes crassus]|uniref:Calponin-homology (CH) domain-containing protein n=1 Tax=Euplotes crassus TaxID=5936 RepID=A0AAD1XW96_EUPCR|nr:unnamed protein product [Moneuplotes crassus]
MEAPYLDEEEMQIIYNWVDEIPLSRPKRNISRDFADGVLMAEIIAHYFPSFVELHNYSQANSVTKKIYNWNTLNQKVFKKLGFQISKKDIEGIVNAHPEIIERVLKKVKDNIENYRSRKPGSKKGVKKASGIKPYQKAMHGIDMNMMDINNTENMEDEREYLKTQVDTELLIEKEQTIQELRETIGILEIKLKKFEQLVKLKDQKIHTLSNKLQEYEDVYGALHQEGEERM